MKKGIGFLLLALCLPLCGCAALLERSYSVVEPYADRYWDPGAEDTLRAENYQDLVNSLLMLVEQRSEEGAIRCYEEAHSYQLAQEACQEVREETALGAYLLANLTFTYENSVSYCTLTCRMTYRRDAEDLSGVMTLSDSQSLVDLLRLAVREDHPKLTAQFVYDTPREEVLAAVESFWQELCQGEAAEEDVQPLEPSTGQLDAEEKAGDAEGKTDESEEPKSSQEDGAPSEQDPPEEPESPAFPPCPWTVRFYPDQASAEIVEVLLDQPLPAAAPASSLR